MASAGAQTGLRRPICCGDPRHSILALGHLVWVCGIRSHFDAEILFPITEDPLMAIARAYGMIHAKAADVTTVRAVSVIGPEGVIRAITWYAHAGRVCWRVTLLFVAIGMVRAALGSSLGKVFDGRACCSCSRYSW
ncbi:MAG: hypothetical protein P4M05_22655 [Bradyrhizobium sp.]|nr:hypothetical protein [Bradyrhizobium sp.]